VFDSTAGEGGVPALLAGKYRLERELGRGGMGVVYQATHTALRLRVAIKVVLPELAQNPLVITRVLREARCAAQITGDHVVRVIDVGQLASGQPFIVMEYVEGEDLARRLGRGGPLPLHAAVHALLEACIAIAEAHAKGIVHRDLKPSNLFLARAADGRELIKVLDFGISKQADGEAPVTRPNDVMGSPNYMAPEQICAPLGVDARADLWALGAILVELATGRRVFPGDTITAVYSRVLAGEPELPEADSSELPKELVAVVRRCLRKDPGERFQSVHELVAALAPFAPPASAPALRAIARFERTALEGSGAAGSTTPSPPSPFGSSLPGSPRARSRLRRSPRLIVAGVGLGLALSAAAAVGAGGPAGEPRSLRRVSTDVEEKPNAECPIGTNLGQEARGQGPSELAAAAPLAAFPAASPVGADAGVPVVRVLAAAGPGEPSVDAARPPPRERPPHASPASGPAPDGVAEPEGARSAPIAPAPPLRNPWDVTTFGGRS
jgi:eukaryotic-like serine/threonine-protein kinase